MFLPGECPGYRAPDPGTLAFGRTLTSPRRKNEPPVEAPRGVAPFEFTANTSFRTFTGQAGRGSCIGGGSGAFRLVATWQLAAEVDGCRINGLETNFSGDILNYLVGLRWVPAPSGRWS